MTHGVEAMEERASRTRNQRSTPNVIGMYQAMNVQPASLRWQAVDLTGNVENAASSSHLISLQARSDWAMGTWLICLIRGVCTVQRVRWPSAVAYLMSQSE